MGTLTVTRGKGKEVFSFEYAADWLKSGFTQILDPDLQLYSGAYYPRDEKVNFGVFMDSCPDRWGRVLMQRREAAMARSEGRTVRELLESDYLLGVFDGHRMGAWEMVVNELAQKAGLNISLGMVQRFNNRYHTYLTKRFDRTEKDERIHFASAMTLLGYTDGERSAGASYLELVESITRNGVAVKRDLEELWRRIVFSICVKNTGDHLRNHGFLLTDAGWLLSPAYDIVFIIIFITVSEQFGSNNIGKVFIQTFYIYQLLKILKNSDLDGCTQIVEEAFGFSEMSVFSLHDLYAGKICAALDRPHHLFDVRLLFGMYCHNCACTVYYEVPSR